MPTVLRAGVDTWGPGWYLGEGSPHEKAIKAQATGRAGRGLICPEPIAGYRVGYFPGQGLLYAEGHPDAGGLCSPADLPAALVALVEGLGAAGLSVPEGRYMEDGRPGFAGLRRCDLTVDLTGTGAEGAGLLRGVAALDPGRWMVDVKRKAAGLETVTWTGTGKRRGIARRVYDKGVESRTAPRGTLIRLEAQLRWPKGQRRAVDEMSVAYARGLFVKRFAPLARASKGVRVVSNLQRFVNEVMDRVEAGELKFAEAERVIAYQQIAQAGRDRTPGASRKTLYNRRALVAETGLVLSEHGTLEEVEVDLHGVLGQVLETDAWERRG